MYRLLLDVNDHQVRLNSEQEHYLKRVLRLQDGDRFVVMDGLGKTWLAHLAGACAVLDELLQENCELPLTITLMVALPKGNAFEDIVRCCTELGVRNIIPIQSEYSLLAPSAQKLARWRKIAREAAEQSERQYLPQITSPVSFCAGLTQIPEDQFQRYICVTRKAAPHLASCLRESSLSPLAILTGPEGGWTEAEVNMAIAAGYQPVSLGCRILRAVTAPIYVMSVISSILESQQDTLTT